MTIRLNALDLTDLDSLTDLNLRSTSGIGSTVAYVGAPQVLSHFIPLSKLMEMKLKKNMILSDIITDPYFALDRRNRYGLKIYSEPYDKDIGDTLMGEFIGTCSIGSTEITVMQPVGSGLLLVLIR